MTGKTEFGQELSSQAANDVYLLKTLDDTITGVLSLQQGVDINKHLTDTQEHIYTVGQILGIVGENDPNALIYTSTNFITNGDNRKVVVEKLDAQVKLNADGIADILAAIGVDSGTSPLPTGIAPLDADGKVPLVNLPNSLLQYLGTWDASTNTPTLADGTGVENTWYRVNVAGSQDLGSGSIAFNVGDKAVHNGTIWEKWDTNDEVTTVHGRTGDVISQAGDYNASQVGLGNVTNDAQLKREAGDINTFTEKLSPVNADVILIEDSEDSLNKKKVQLSNISVGGSSNLAVRTETSNYTATVADDLILCDTTSAFTITLPTAVGNEGKVFRFKKITNDTNAVTIDGDSSEEIDGNLTEAIYVENESLIIASDNVNWVVLYRGRIESSAAYITDAGQSLSAATGNTLIYEDLVFNNNIDYNTSTGVMTAQSPGRYLVVAAVASAGENWNTADTIALDVTVNSVASSGSRSFLRIGFTGFTSYQEKVSSIVDLAVSDTVEVICTPTQAFNVATTLNRSYVQIFKLGD